MHVNIEELKHVLNMFLDNQPVYFGRSGTFPGAPRAIIKGSNLSFRKHVTISCPFCRGLSIIYRQCVFLNTRQRGYVDECKTKKERKDTGINKKKCTRPL